MENGEFARFYQASPSMPEGPVPHAKDKSVGGCYIWTPTNEFLRCLLGLPSDCSGT